MLVPRAVKGVWAPAHHGLAALADLPLIVSVIPRRGMAALAAWDVVETALAEAEARAGQMEMELAMLAV